HGSTGDQLYNCRFLYEIYTRAAPDYTGRVTVPVLWDKKRETIVNNESREIMRMFDHAFADLGDPSAPDLAPLDLLADIDAMIDANYEPVNNGVYKCGFATTQEAYDEAIESLFSRLDELDALLQRQQWLIGDTLTEADICLYTTLVRFDPVYAIHFKCSRRRIVDYPGLRRYLHDLWQIPAFRETTNMAHIRRHYYWSHESINPHRIVAAAPAVQAIDA
ncbi:MAG: glutathione S-transferase family protein, partial [Candidatus Dadabacteria bacterium]